MDMYLLSLPRQASHAASIVLGSPRHLPAVGARAPASSRCRRLSPFSSPWSPCGRPGSRSHSWMSPTRSSATRQSVRYGRPPILQQARKAPEHAFADTSFASFQLSYIMKVVTGGTCAITDIAPCVCTNLTLQANLSASVQQSCSFQDQIRTSLFTPLSLLRHRSLIPDNAAGSADIMSNLCVGYPQEVKKDTVKLGSTIGIAVSVPIVALRLFTRAYTTGRLWMDDYLTIANLVSLPRGGEGE